LEGLDLFKDWTPEMVEYLKKKRGPRHGETLEEKQSRLKRGIHSPESKLRAAKARRRYLAGLTLEKMDKRLKNSFHSDKAKSKAGRWYRGLSFEAKENFLKHSFHSPEAIRKSGKGKKEFQASLSLEQKKENSKNSFNSDAAVRARNKSIRKFHASLSKEERLYRARHSFRTPEAEARGAESTRRYWAKLTKEEKLEKARKSFHSDEAIKHRIKALRVRPTIPEKIVGWYLEEKFPGEYSYNGDFSLGITIGGRIPDFVNVNGEKEVISVMGGLGFCHFLGDEEVEIAHYAKYGFRCVVIWEWDCTPKGLDKILKEKGGIYLKNENFRDIL